MTQTALTALPTSPAQRIKATMEQARLEASVLVQETIQKMDTLADECRTIADLGAAVPVGVREYAKVSAERYHADAGTLRAILARNP